MKPANHERPPSPLRSIDDRLRQINVQLLRIRIHANVQAARLGRNFTRIMATFVEFRAKLDEQNTALLEEIVQVNAKLDDLRNNPNVPEDVMTALDASIATIKGIIADPLPPVS